MNTQPPSRGNEWVLEKQLVEVKRQKTEVTLWTHYIETVLY